MNYYYNPYILNVYWEDIMKSTLDRVQGCSELKEYYTKYYQKYIEIFQDGYERNKNKENHESN